MLRLDDLSSDLLVNILLHLNVSDLCRVARTSRRLCYLVDSLSSAVLGTECASAFSADIERFPKAKYESIESARLAAETPAPLAVLKRALGGMRSRPSLALTFSASAHPWSMRRRAFPAAEMNAQAAVEAALPEDCVVLGASAPDIVSPKGNGRGGGDDGGDDDDEEEGFSCLLASFDRDRTVFLPFSVSDLEDDEAYDYGEGGKPTSAAAKLGARLRDATPSQKERSTKGGDAAAAHSSSYLASFWKVIFVYVSGHESDIDGFISSLQSLFPSSRIVGGVCGEGHVRLPSNRSPPASENGAAAETLASSSLGSGGLASSIAARRRKSHRHRHYHVSDGIFGLAIGGDVPIHSVVTRGVRSLSTGAVGGADPSSPWRILDASVVAGNWINDEDSDDSMEGMPGGPERYLRIKAMLNAETNETMSSLAWLCSLVRSAGSRPGFLGLKKDGSAGFDLLPIKCIGDDLFVPLDADDIGNYKEGDYNIVTSVDLFQIDGAACLKDVDVTLDALRDLVSSKNERVMGAVLFSCSGRGPELGPLLPEVEADASRFRRRFPGVPIAGFYAGGEIGPRAVAGCIGGGVLRKGRAELQGFTAVFALFIVPPRADGKFHFDDGPEEVARHMGRRMKHSAEVL